MLVDTKLALEMQGSRGGVECLLRELTAQLARLCSYTVLRPLHFESPMRAKAPHACLGGPDCYKGFVILSRMLLWASIVLLAPQVSAAQAVPDVAMWSAPHPKDPFAGEYELPRKRQIGTTAGQFRMVGSGMITLGGKAPGFGVHGGLELMTFPYLGVRGSLQTTVYARDASASASSEPLVFAAKAGPSFHLLPYRRVDLSLFFEGGVAVVEPTKPDSTPMPIFSPGGTLELWLSHFAFLRLEGRLDWGLYDRAGEAQRYRRFGGLLGLGIAI